MGMREFITGDDVNAVMAKIRELVGDDMNAQTTLLVNLMGCQVRTFGLNIDQISEGIRAASIDGPTLTKAN